MRSTLDPLRYGIRALDEMAREQASVAPPPPSREATFSPHPVLRPAARDGSALSLRIFTDGEDDATALVLGDAASHRFAPIPPRAAALFEAHAAMVAEGREEALSIGFPLATFVQQGSARAAPLFSRGGGRARFFVGDAAWKLPSGAGARDGAPFALPDALVLEVGGDDPITLHAGVWHFLFGLDGAALGAIAAAGRGGLGALVRAATRALDAGGESVDPDPPPSGPLVRDDVAAFGEAATRRAAPARALRCHPHGLAMMPPRGDPTSGLRSDLHDVLEQPLPPRGPLAVYLGARPATSRGDVFTSGKVPPTPSQLEAARAFEGSEDIVAVCGPPGCGKTALLHHVTAQTVLACALGTVWTTAPSRTGAWPLVVVSTNNAAVDHALAPFVSGSGAGRGSGSGSGSGSGLPVALRLGNRRLLADATAAALTSAIAVLEAPGEMPLAEARAAFEARAANVRTFLRDRSEARKSRAASAEVRRARETRAAALTEELGRMPDGPPPPVDLVEVAAAEDALREHAEAAARLAPLHIEGAKASIPRACEKWARANALRSPRIAPVLDALGVALPFGDLDASRPLDDISGQRAAIAATLALLSGVHAQLEAPALRRELAAIREALRAAPDEPPGLPLDPGLYDAALAVRDAWARAHRGVLLPRLVAARDAARGDRTEARGRPLGVTLRELAPLFPLAGCTLLSMRGSFPLERDVIDRLVIDEAAQCAPIYAVPALARARRAMLTGDTAQLPPVYTLDPRLDDRLARGLDEAAVAPFRMGTPSTSSAQAVAEARASLRRTLREHFRSQHAIVLLASRWSGHALDVRTPPRSLASVSPRLASAVSALTVRGIGARAPEGVVNEPEAACVVALVADLLGDGVAPSDIAVLTPFVGQCARIERELLARGMPVRDGVLVSTVHRLQGGERRVVVFSLAATERRHLRWLAERPHLLHVATSRAQDHLVVVFDPDAAAGEPTLAPLLELIELA